MINACMRLVECAIGLNVFSYTTILHMIIRGIIIYFFGILVARFDKKLMGIRTPFNFILFIMLGSIFSDAIFDEKLFLPIIFTTIVLMVLNSLVTVATYYLPIFELWMSGEPVLLIKDGEMQWNIMKKHFITESDLLHELYIQLHTRDIQQVESAYLTSHGTVNFIKKSTS